MSHVWLVNLQTDEAKKQLVEAGRSVVKDRLCIVIDPNRQETVLAWTRGLPLGAKRQTDVASLTAPRQRDSAMGLQFGAATSVAAHKTDVPKKYRTAGSRRCLTRTGGPQFCALNCDRIGANVWRG
ncbi:hypothetical protein HPB52_005599 [Rhipicephalus sanguineus]|uniref:Uncharacterized protein n=1 Tax=Rhipicephalus sanguineus TaxID=34632 RepID=A0A9D4PKX5_RHISA|nr:hypothetical protein HPB52_005599 [Rhipicephalus sanguineus]